MPVANTSVPVPVTDPGSGEELPIGIKKPVDSHIFEALANKANYLVMNRFLRATPIIIQPYIHPRFYDDVDRSNFEEHVDTTRYIPLDLHPQTNLLHAIIGYSAVENAARECRLKLKAFPAGTTVWTGADSDKGCRFLAGDLPNPWPDFIGALGGKASTGDIVPVDLTVVPALTNYPRNLVVNASSLELEVYWTKMTLNSILLMEYYVPNTAQ